jgi:predicted DNA-binding transcriptional regulator YafY
MRKPRQNRYRAAGATTARLVAAIRALTTPCTPYELAEAIGVHYRTAYRLIDQLRDAGVPIVEDGHRDVLRRDARSIAVARLRLEHVDIRRWTV